MKPSIGRVVHYVNDDCISRAALITEVYGDQVVGLVVFGDGESCRRVKSAIEDFSQVPKPFTWHWPPREKDSIDLRPKEFGIANADIAG